MAFKSISVTPTTPCKTCIHRALANKQPSDSGYFLKKMKLRLVYGWWDPPNYLAFVNTLLETQLPLLMEGFFCFLQAQGIGGIEMAFQQLGAAEHRHWGPGAVGGH